MNNVKVVLNNWAPNGGCNVLFGQKESSDYLLFKLMKRLSKFRLSFVNKMFLLLAAVYHVSKISHELHDFRKKLLNVDLQLILENSKYSNSVSFTSIELKFGLRVADPNMF